MKRYLGNLCDREKVNIEDLVDIQDVRIDTSLPREERIQSYLAQIKNPYCYRCDDIIVRASFADTGETLEDRMKEYWSLKMRHNLLDDL